MSNADFFDLQDGPLVSIGIPVYNSRDTIIDSVKSALSQDYRNIEIIISDNASTDGTYSMCKLIAGADSRVRLFRQDQNIGALKNFTFVLEKSSGEYFKWLGADDIISSDTISKSMSKILNSQSFIACAQPHYFDIEFEGTGKAIVFEMTGNFVSRIHNFFRNPGRSHGLLYAVVERRLLISYPRLSVDFFAWDWCLILYLLSKGPIASSENSFLISGSKGESSTNRIYEHYGLTGVRRIMPFLMFNVNVWRIARNWTFGERFLLAINLVQLNIKSMVLDLRFIRYKFSAFRKSIHLLLKKSS